VINVGRTEQARQRARNALLRQMVVLERNFEPKIRTVLNIQYTNAAAAVASGGKPGPAINSVKPRLKQELTRHYTRVAELYGPPMITEAEKKAEALTPLQAFWKAILEWIKLETAAKVTLVSEATKLKIAAIVKQGMEAGISHKEIARKIREKAKIANPSRARTIARTETHNAAVNSMREGVKSTGVKMKKRWVSAMDKRTRTSHLEAHQRYNRNPIDIDTTYLVGEGSGFPMMYPGDGSYGAPAKEIVNCRCVELYDRAGRR